MSYANGTQFYNLPQTVGTDKRDWFDTNSAFAAIDAALHSAVTGQASDAEAIATINSKLATDEADIAALQTKGNTHDSQIAALQTTVNTQASQIADVRQDVEDMISAYNEGAAETSTHAYAIGDYFIYNDVLYKATAAIAIGDTIVPNTNCQATNVTTEINVVSTDVAGKLDASDVYNGLDSNSTTKALSAVQGKNLKKAIYKEDVFETATADGVKTWKELVHQLYSKIHSLDAYKYNLAIVVDETVYPCTYKDSSDGYWFTGIYGATASGINGHSFYIAPNVADCIVTRITAGVCSDYSNSVASNGKTFELIG